MRSRSNDYNLNIPRYIDSTERGGHPGPQRPPARRHPRPRHGGAGPYWKVYPGLRKELFKPNTRPGYSDLKVPADRSAGHRVRPPGVHHLREGMESVLGQWRKAHEPPNCADRAKGVKPRVFIRALSEALLAPTKARRWWTPTPCTST
jgi:type I restriction enzyme M protein